MQSSDVAFFVLHLARAYSKDCCHADAVLWGFMHHLQKFLLSRLHGLKNCSYVGGLKGGSISNQNLAKAKLLKEADRIHRTLADWLWRHQYCRTGG